MLMIMMFAACLADALCFASPDSRQSTIALRCLAFAFSFIGRMLLPDAFCSRQFNALNFMCMHFLYLRQARLDSSQP